jgi:hypothetical protein
MPISNREFFILEFIFSAHGDACGGHGSIEVEHVAETQELQTHDSPKR